MECSAGRRERPPPQRPARVTTELHNFAALKQCHDESHHLIQQGLICDEQGKKAEARSFYGKGLQGINRGLNVNCEDLQASTEEKAAAKLMQQKMTKTKLQIEYRLQALNQEDIREVPSAPTLTEEPPSYDDSVSDCQYVSLSDSIMTSSVNRDELGNLTANATEIFSISEGVQIFYISPEGYVSAPSYPSSLRIFQFLNREQETDDRMSTDSPPAFLQVGDWCYPLVPGTSPALHTNYGGYVFPDTSSDAASGSSVGLILPDSATADQRQTLEDVMLSLTVLREQEQQLEEIPEEIPPVSQDLPATTDTSTSARISKGILTAADCLTWGVGKGAEKAGQLLKYGSDKIKARITPEEQQKPVHPQVQTGVHYVRQSTHIAVSVSSYLVSKLGQATMALAREVAPHIRKKGEQLLPKSLKETSTDGKSKVDGVIEVAASGLKGFGTVFTSLEAAAKALGRNITHETAEIVGKKYGTDAGALTEDMLFSAGNIAMTAYNANHFGVKAIAKRAAKDTGKAVFEDLKEAKKRPPPRPDHHPDMGRHEN